MLRTGQRGTWSDGRDILTFVRFFKQCTIKNAVVSAPAGSTARDRVAGAGERGPQAGRAASDESRAPPPPPAGPSLCLRLPRPDDLSREGSESPGPSPAPPLLHPGPVAAAGPRARPPSPSPPPPPPPPRSTKGPTRPRLLRT